MIVNKIVKSRTHKPTLVDDQRFNADEDDHDDPICIDLCLVNER